MESKTSATTAARTSARREKVDTRITLADLERLVAQRLIQSRLEATKKTIARVGNPIVRAGRLRGYTAARYGGGEWISAGVVRRVERALAEGTA